MKYIELIRKLYRGRKHFTPPLEVEITDAFSTEVLKNLNTKGIHIEPNFLSEEQVKYIRDHIDQRLDAVPNDSWIQVRDAITKDGIRFGISLGDEWKFWIDEARSDSRIIHAEYMDPLIYQFANDERFKRIGEAYLRKKVSLKFCMVNRTTWKPNNLGSGGGWHRDNNYKRGFKALLYLTDSDEQNGCFQYIERSANLFHHLLKTPIPDKHEFTNEEVMKMVGSNEHKITNAVAKAGTLVMFDTNGVHRGKPLEQGGSRYAMTNYYAD